MNFSYFFTPPTFQLFKSNDKQHMCKQWGKVHVPFDSKLTLWTRMFWQCDAWTLDEPGWEIITKTPPYYLHSEYLSNLMHHHLEMHCSGGLSSFAWTDCTKNGLRINVRQFVPVGCRLHAIENVHTVGRQSTKCPVCPIWTCKHFSEVQNLPEMPALWSFL